MLFKLFDKKSDLEKSLQNNQPRLVVAGNKNICIIRQENRLIAFENECPHMGQGLNEGLVNYMNEIVCPLHAYKFDLKHGEEENKRCSPLQFITVHLKDDGVFLEV